MSNVDHPDHYRADTGHEAIDVIEAWGLGFCLGNCVKYIARCGRKGDRLEDLEKARWYLDREIAKVRQEPREGPGTESSEDGRGDAIMEKPMRSLSNGRLFIGPPGSAIEMSHADAWIFLQGLMNESGKSVHEGGAVEMTVDYDENVIMFYDEVWNTAVSLSFDWIDWLLDTLRAFIELGVDRVDAEHPDVRVSEDGSRLLIGPSDLGIWLRKEDARVFLRVLTECPHSVQMNDRVTMTVDVARMCFRFERDSSGVAYSVPFHHLSWLIRTFRTFVEFGKGVSA